MITWWMWIVLWVVLSLAALAYLVWQGFRLVRKGLAALRELTETGDRLGAIGDGIEEPEPSPPFQPAIFADPVQLRADRMLRKRAKAASRRRTSA